MKIMKIKHGVKIFNVVLFWLMTMSIMISSTTLEKAHYQLALKYYHKNLYREAVTEFKEFFRSYPNSSYYSEACFYAAKSYYQTADYQQALEYFIKAELIETDPLNIRKIVFGKAQCYYQLGFWKKAAETFTLFAVQYSDSPVAPAALYYGAVAYRQSGNGSLYQHYMKKLESDFYGDEYYHLALSQGHIKKEISEDKKSETEDKKHPQEIQKEIIQYKEIERISVITNRKWITNRIEQTNYWNVYLTNRITLTNHIKLYKLLTNTEKIYETNSFSMTNYFTNYKRYLVFETNTVTVSNEYEAEVALMETNRQETEKEEELDSLEEEIERLRNLMEMKARLLELKENAIKQKEKLVQETNK